MRQNMAKRYKGEGNPRKCFCWTTDPNIPYEHTVDAHTPEIKLITKDSK